MRFVKEPSERTCSVVLGKHRMLVADKPLKASGRMSLIESNPDIMHPINAIYWEKMFFVVIVFLKTQLIYEHIDQECIPPPTEAEWLERMFRVRF